MSLQGSRQHMQAKIGQLVCQLMPICAHHVLAVLPGRGRGVVLRSSKGQGCWAMARVKGAVWSL